MKLSVVIPCFNMEQYLPSCLDSLLRQGLGQNELQILVVNDGSSDRTLEIAEQYSLINPCIKVIDKLNNGVGAARNTGLDLASGKYLYFLDPDDYLADNTLKTLLTIIESNDLEILSFNSLKVKNNFHQTSVSNKQSSALIIKDGITYIASKKYQNEIWWFLINTAFLKRSGIRFIEGKWMEDAILTAQLFCVTKRMAHVELDIHRYRILPTSAMRNKTPDHYNKVIFDNANAAKIYDELITSIPNDHPKADACRKRLKVRQQSFVFFLLVRLMKSELKLTNIKPLLKSFKPIGAYPLDQFLGQDYNGINYQILVFIFNRQELIIPFMRFYRTITLNFK